MEVSSLLDKFLILELKINKLINRVTILETNVSNLKKEINDNSIIQNAFLEIIKENIEQLRKDVVESDAGIIEDFQDCIKCVQRGEKIYQD